MTDAIRWEDAKETLLKQYIEQPRVGLITDVDGTISPIVNVPSEAKVTERSRQLLTEMSGVFTLVGALSGRKADDIHERVGVDGLVYVGNHGFERWEDGSVSVIPEVQEHLAALQAVVAYLNAEVTPEIPGMWVEDKGATLTVHYRSVDDPDRVAEEFLPAMQNLAESHGLRVSEGRRVWEFRPPLEINKGVAFRMLVEGHTLDSAMYIGDDVTDVDAFIAARELREAGQAYGLAVGVESDDTPEPVRNHADVLVSGVEGVEEFFAWLLASRRASSN